MIRMRDQNSILFLIDDIQRNIIWLLLKYKNIILCTTPFGSCLTMLSKITYLHDINHQNRLKLRRALLY